MVTVGGLTQGEELSYPPPGTRVLFFTEGFPNFGFRGGVTLFFTLGKDIPIKYLDWKSLSFF